MQKCLRSSKRLLSKYIIRNFFFVITPLCFPIANSQESPTQTSSFVTEVATLSTAELLNKAQLLQQTDRKTAFELANKVLRISKIKRNTHETAKAHSLLAQLNRQENNTDKSLHHFLQASLIYKNLNDKQNQILSSIDYAKLFFSQKRYNEGNKIIDEILPIAQNFGDKLSVALIFITKGNSYYQKKHYDDAIKQYTYAVSFLSDKDSVIQKQLGETYTKIAESYQHIKNKKQTVSFYKKSLDIYTALHDRKLMARTLSSLAKAERNLDNYLIALNYSVRSLEIHKQLDDPEGRADALTGAGVIYRYIGRYEKSLKHIHEAYLYYKKVNDASGTAITSNQMGFIYTRLKQFDQAKSFYQLTIDMPDNKIESKTLASALREMAVIHLNSGEYESAKVMAQKAYKIYKNKNDKLKGSLIERIIANIYRAEKNDTKAIAHYRESLSLATQIGKKIYQIKAQTALAGVLIGKNTGEAIKLLKNSLVLSNQINTKSQKLYAYRLLLQAEKSQGNITEALRYAEEEISLTLILQNEKEYNELILAKANLYSHKMEIELDSLREKTKLDQLELIKKSNDIEIAEQEIKISELELIKNKYASITLTLALATCLLVVLFIYRRFIESKKRNKELNYLAAHDPLTNCYNRRILFDILERDFADITLPEEYCILMVDIDHFKKVNDTYGHSTGDIVIRGVADILQGCIRQNDITARFGGEEFCIVLPNASQKQAMHIAEIMRQKVESNHFDDITVSCSFGVTSIQFNAKSPTELIKQADLALYKSKKYGRNQVTLWDKAL
jgi:diguanylate cyclase (GGDEF)-like protein